MRVLLAVILTLGLVQSVLVLGAALLYRQSTFLITGGSELAFVHERLTLAEQLDPRNRAVGIQLAALAPTAEQRLHRFRSLTSAEPYLAEAWFGLLVAKLDLRQVDDELANAMAKLEQVAPFEPAILERVIAEGVSAWLVLRPEMRNAVIQAGARALQTSADFRRGAILRQLDISGLRPLVCSVSKGAQDCQGLTGK